MNLQNRAELVAWGGMYILTQMHHKYKLKRDDFSKKKRVKRRKTYQGFVKRHRFSQLLNKAKAQGKAMHVSFCKCWIPQSKLALLFGDVLCQSHTHPIFPIFLPKKKKKKIQILKIHIYLIKITSCFFQYVQHMRERGEFKPLNP